MFPCLTVTPMSVPTLLVRIHIINCPHVSLSHYPLSPCFIVALSTVPVSLSDSNTNISPTVTGNNSHYPLLPCLTVTLSAAPMFHCLTVTPTVTGHNLHYPLSPCFSDFHCPVPISVLLPLVIIHIIHCPHVSLFYTNISPTCAIGHNSHYPLSPCFTVLYQYQSYCHWS